MTRLMGAVLRRKLIGTTTTTTTAATTTTTTTTLVTTTTNCTGDGTHPNDAGVAAITAIITPWAQGLS